jgi:hypothetical protein
MQEKIKIIQQAIAERLQRGFHDGYCYSPDEWRLLKLGLVHSQTSLGEIKAYYALVEIQTTPDPEDAIAVFEIDGNDPGWETGEMEEAVLIGNAEGYFPDDAVELQLVH